MNKVNEIITCRNWKYDSEINGNTIYKADGDHWKIIAKDGSIDPKMYDTRGAAMEAAS